MNRKRLLWLVPLWLAAAVFLAFWLRESVEQLIIRPMFYLLWMLNLLYHAIPQVVLWIGLLSLILVLALSFVLRNISFDSLRPRRKIRRLGPVAELAQTIQRESSGVYFKWQVARSLSEIALDLQSLRTHLDSRNLHLDESEAPPAVRRYLDAGLHSSFSDYPIPGLFQPRPQTPFDLELDPVLDYLESQTEMDK